MSETARYYMNGFLLKVYDSAYVVEVKPANGETGLYAQYYSIPEWVFRSPHSIWISEEETPAPLFIKAKKGEEIKQQILQNLR